jgi:REP element-mobilizing transposase RayT
MLHHVMIRGIERRNIFRSHKDRDDLIERLAYLLPETKTFCYAWAFLSNHAHFLMRSGPSGIAVLMRRLLTGYVVSFNRRHHRTGQLFQNRYKSIICEEDVYFKDLVRYIHLNPLRANLVSTLSDLDGFPYSGHSALMATKERPWQDTAYVLGFFSQDTERARGAYHAYVESGIDQGRREDLAGGGLVRSFGGWSEITHQGQRVKGDQRILGGSEFVLKVLAEADQQYAQKGTLRAQRYTPETLADTVAAANGLRRDDILSKGRQKHPVEARSLFCYLAVQYLGTSTTDLARLLGMVPSAISYAVKRGKRIAEEKGSLVVGELLNY